MAVFDAKMGLQKLMWQPKLHYFVSAEIIEVKNRIRKTDRHTNSLTPYTDVCGFFLQFKFATSLLSLLAGGLDP